jgi:hypothetical protein
VSVTQVVMTDTLARPYPSSPETCSAGLSAYHSFMASRTKPLLAVGNEVEWARINEEEARQEAESAASLSLPERLEFGQRLCDQAFELVNAMRASGHGSGRDPRS